MIDVFDTERFILNPSQYIIEFFGDEVGQVQIVNSDLPQVVEDAKYFMKNGIEVENRIPTKMDIIKLCGYCLSSANMRSSINSLRLRSSHGPQAVCPDGPDYVPAPVRK
jgi:hypothetical protein